jgi:8-oxo-dGTP pyrophosphatase MutT (NUDIX family)
MQYDKKPIYRAGTIPYIIENGEVLMMFMKPSNTEFGGNEFQIAKGRIEDGEDTKTAALREAREELGMFLSNIISTEELGVFMGRTTVYVAKMKDRSMFGEPSFETAETAWLTLEQFAHLGRDLHMPVIMEAHRKIKTIEDLE